MSKNNPSIQNQVWNKNKNSLSYFLEITHFFNIFTLEVKSILKNKDSQSIHSFKYLLKLDTAAHVFNFSTWEAEAGLFWVQGQFLVYKSSRLDRVTWRDCLKKQTNNKTLTYLLVHEFVPYYSEDSVLVLSTGHGKEQHYTMVKLTGSELGKGSLFYMHQPEATPGF